MKVEYQAPVGSDLGFVKQNYISSSGTKTNTFGSTTGPDIFYQPPPCLQAPQDRPVGCFPGNPDNVPGCSATNWDSRPSANCYEAYGLNVLDIWLRNRACRAGIFTTLTEVQVTLDGVTTNLTDVGPIPDCDVSSDLRVCFYVPGFGTASNWVANAIYNFGAVSPQCVAVATEQGLNVTEACFDTVQGQCETIASNSSQNARQVCGSSTELNSVDIQARQSTIVF